MNTKTTQLLIMMAAIAIIFVVAYVYATRHVASLTKKTAELQQEIGNLQITYKHEENLQKAVLSAADHKSKIAGYFIPAGGAVDFISRLERTAAGFGLEYNTQNIIEEDADMLAAQNKQLLRVSFSAQGGWQKVMRLLRAVESLPYGMNIDKIDLGASLPAVTPAASGVTVKPASRQWSAVITFSIVKTKDNAKQD